MYSLTIHFGPHAICWAFLFKDKEKAEASFALVNRWDAVNSSLAQFHIVDDYGQDGWFAYAGVHGALLEDTELVMEARIFRSLDNARGEIKAKQRAMSDPVIRTAQNGPGVIAPNFGRQ